MGGWLPCKRWFLCPILIALTDAERKRKERAEHKKAGRVPVTVHVLPEYREEVRALEAKLQRRENRKARK